MNAQIFCEYFLRQNFCILARIHVIWINFEISRGSNSNFDFQGETPVNVVIHLDVPFQTIVDRVKDRLVHPGSGRIYNLLFSPPKVEGRDDVTGEPLIQREDDKPESVRNRLQVFSDQTRPVLDYFREKGILAEFQGTESKVIYPNVKEFLDKKFQ